MLGSVECPQRGPEYPELQLSQGGDEDVGPKPCRTNVSEGVRSDQRSKW